ncbi:MAG TPA: GNAT family N-acetyltransferase [Chitinophagaceae bacterium]|nr:GNAT family N-acetyltransferase [Chitinophagaceae bacterium]
MITIRTASREDLDALTVLFDLYRIWYHQPSDIAAARKFLLQRIEKNESVILIAEQEGKLLGFTQLYPIFSSVSLRKAWLLNDLYVHAAARNQGVAVQMLNAARLHGKESGAKWLMLQTGNDNYRAQSVYEKNGWKRISDYFYELPLED